MKKGDFSNLAIDYAKYRPSYNVGVVNTILRAIKTPLEKVSAADVGAGTGIFTKCLRNGGIRDIVAVEPNYNMRQAGEAFLNHKVKFINGSAEYTHLEPNRYDLVTMASAFHWPNTQDALTEFNRILNKGGIFSALWNPRLTERSTIESKIQDLLIDKYNLKSRVSSGLSGITKELEDILTKSGFFRSISYVESIDIVRRSHNEYIGAWRSVNDIQVQLGKDKFIEFLDDVGVIIKDYPDVEVHYLTRAWIAEK
ncbi:class I SAM-dependent methyltransferase [Alphaproteobacteria bacterium]|nr:class I SAM-dependent methyltransferase [Alphaproteobacteria bacterium]